MALSILGSDDLEVCVAHSAEEKNQEQQRCVKNALKKQALVGYRWHVLVISPVTEDGFGDNRRDSRLSEEAIALISTIS